MARKLDSLEILDAPNRSVWRDWLAAHHSQPDGIWLILYKKASGQRQMTYADAVEEALCFGWIDSAPRKVDEATFQLYFSPRKKGSVWSAVNKKRVAELLAAGLMQPAGQAKIAAAQLDGSWAALEAVDALEIPADLAAALAANETARRHFDAFPPSARKQILQQLAAAKRPETRRQRIERLVEKAAQNQRL
ncbi:YdeI/OmpD-associated family protein [Microvirga sp. STR05]|uniref:YdeI/OmpD-associated family protein n=1 Tax=Hymenobacter duratus TaxID=2771356 RepID=A0ABR8JHM6_9BACT|nr:YdeI/OmpD-associated family protein [Hymenobacter duratus]MBD2714895.1 YdeI/OmpD-associated family protein [Hymenobacter duratus]MBR7949801.1 YdeI/OmpD-associated family protein [Microvirga sp. STR05]